TPVRDRPLQPIKLGHERRPGTGLFDRKQSIDLDSCVERQARASHRGARMTPFLPKDFNDELGGAVDHLWVVSEAGYRVYIAVQAQTLNDTIKIAQGRFGLGENVESAYPRGILALIDVEIGAERAGDSNFPLLHRQLAGDVKLVVEVEKRHVIGDRGGYL